MFSDVKMKIYSLCTGYINVQAHSLWCDQVGWNLFGLESGELSGSTSEYFKETYFCLDSQKRRVA